VPVTHEHEHRVTPLELFFDLVFVFAITQVTTLLSDDPTWRGLGRGMLVLGALWWAWGAYAWLTNMLDPEEGAVRLAVFASMGAMLVASLAVPEAFGDHGVVFGCAYLVVRLLHLALYALAGRGDADVLGTVLRFTPSSLAGSVLIIVAGFTDGSLRPTLWLAALAIDYLGPLVGGVEGLRLHPAHFAERHGLIVIIAIGESIVAAGIGAAGQPIDTELIVAASLGIGIAAAFWWTYFDWFSIAAEQALSRHSGAARARLARDLYSYVHFTLVAGIILFALAMKKTLAHVGDELAAIPAFGLCGGSAIYLLAFTLFRLRVTRQVSTGRLITAGLLLALWPVVRELPGLGGLALVLAVWVALILYEVLRYHDERAELRAARA
jgi:low temperature requirement protein LtrA